MKTFKNLFEQIISHDNLFISWEKFKKGKRSKPDVAKFEFQLEQNIFKLHRDLKNKTYKHGSYKGFYICDPKVRHIHKATVRDRVIHHAVFRILNSVFEPTFISNSFSCRIGKGNHKGVYTLEKIVRKVSKNYTKPCFALKCDVKKFFDSVDHNILLKILTKKIKDENAIWLVKEIIHSFSSSNINLFHRRGLPIGNLTSQLFANVYMNEFDQFIKHDLRIENYLRYTDDFIIVSDTDKEFKVLIKQIEKFLQEKLALELHPNKVEVRKLHKGIDFLGYRVKSHHKLLRTKTKRRMLRKLHYQVKEFNNGNVNKTRIKQLLQSYLGLLVHANAYKLSEDLKNKIWFWIGQK